MGTKKYVLKSISAASSVKVKIISKFCIFLIFFCVDMRGQVP